jgi:hypothetical protein
MYPSSSKQKCAHCGNRNTIIFAVPRLRSEQPENVCSIRGRGKRTLSSLSLQTSTGAHPDSLQRVLRIFSLGMRGTEWAADDSHLSSADVQLNWATYISTFLVSGSIPGGFAEDFFRGSDETMCPGVDSATKNEYQKLPGGKSGRCVKVTTLPPS